MASNTTGLFELNPYTAADITLHYITLHYITLHYIILHYITLDRLLNTTHSEISLLSHNGNFVKLSTVSCGSHRQTFRL